MAPAALAFLADSSHREDFVKALNAQRQAGQFCDVLLKIAGRTLPTHACVLSACSTVFRELIMADRPNDPHLTNSPQEIELVMPSISDESSRHGDEGLEAMVDLLDYIYTGNIALKRDTIDLVIRLAEAFALESLSSLIKSHAPKKSAKSGRKSTALPQPDETLKSSSSDLKEERSDRQLGKEIEEMSTDKRTVNAESSSLVIVGSKAESQSLRRVTLREVGDGKKKRRSSAGARRNSGGVPRLRHANWEPDVRIGCICAILPSTTYQCVSCDFSTEQCGKMLEHIRQAEHAEMECSLCSSVWPDRDAFLQHLTWHDTHVRPYFCRMCPYHGKSLANLIAHVAKHAVERPYKCDQCGRGFKWSSSLKIHKKSHGTDKMHLCDQCGYSTAYFNNLRVHKRRHNGGMLPCSTCSYQASNPYHLRRHELTHAKLRDVICEICGNCFATAKSLKEHAKLHNLETSQLFCHLCPFKTVRTYRLKSHMKQSHPHDDPGHMPVDL